MKEGSVSGDGLQWADLSSPLVLGLRDYWAGIRGNAVLPRKSAFDPTAVRSLLPYLTVEELHRNPLRIRFRLVGTEQARFAAMDYTGRWLHELPWDPAVVYDLLGQYRRLLSAGEPIYGASRYAWSDGFEKAFEWGLFPFSADGGSIDYVIGIEDFSTIDRDRLDRLLERQREDRRQARPMAGSSGRPAFFAASFF